LLGKGKYTIIHKRRFKSENIKTKIFREVSEVIEEEVKFQRKYGEFRSDHSHYLHCYVFLAKAATKRANYEI